MRGSRKRCREVLVGLMVAEMLVAGCSPPGGASRAGDSAGATAAAGSRGDARKQGFQDPPATVPVDPPAVQAAAVGTLPGDLGVSPGGTSSYAIQIEVPAGPRQMQPSVALSYASGRGNGLLGVGWALSPSSSITRCPQTFANHADPRGVQFSTPDALCLDGELMSTTANSGFDGADYRLRIGRKVKVTGVGWIQQLASGFEVRPGDGSVRYYGAMRDATGGISAGPTLNRYQGTLAAPLAWFLREEQDAYGNRITYDYQPDKNSFRLIRINYAFVNGNPTRSVELSYTRRTDVIQGWDAGVFAAQDQRLTTITTRVRGQDVYRYQLGYKYGAVTHRSLLETVTKCTADDSVCLPPTRFDYQEGTHGFVRVEDGSTPRPAAKFPLGNTPPKHWNYEPSQYGDWLLTLVGDEKQWATAFHVLDANGDGKADLMGRSEAILEAHYWNDSDPDNAQSLEYPNMRRPWMWYGWGTEASPSYSALSMAPSRVDDEVSRLNKQAGWYWDELVAQTENNVVTALDTFTGRFNADGLDDVVEPLSPDPFGSKPPGETFGVASGFQILSSSKGPNPQDPKVGFLAGTFEIADAAKRPIVSYLPTDANGDGLTDLMVCKANGAVEFDENYTRTRRMPGVWHMLLNSTSGFSASAAAGGQSLGIVCDADDLLLLVDFDGDGRADPLVVSVRDAGGGKLFPWNWSNYQAFQFTNTANGVSVTRADTGLPPDKTQRYMRTKDRARVHGFESPAQEKGLPWWRDASAAPTHAGGISDDKVMDVNGDGLKDIVRVELSVVDHETGDLKWQATEANSGADRWIVAMLGGSTEGINYPDTFPTDGPLEPADQFLVVWFNTGHGFVRGGNGSSQAQSFIRQGFSRHNFAQLTPYDYDLDGKEELLGSSGILGDTGSCELIDGDAPELPVCELHPELCEVACDDDAKLLRFDTGKGGNSSWKNVARANATTFESNGQGQLKGGGPVGDFDGDGVADIMRLYADPQTSEESFQIWKRTTEPTDLLTKVVNGARHATRVTYATGATARSYTAPDGLAGDLGQPVHPQVRGYSTGPVVKTRFEDAEDTDAVDEDFNITTYHYSDLRTDLYGRLPPQYQVTTTDLVAADLGIHRRKVTVAGKRAWDPTIRDYQQTTPSRVFSAVNYDVSSSQVLPTTKAMSVAYTETSRAIASHGGIWHTPYVSVSTEKSYEVPILANDACAVNSGKPCGPSRLAAVQPVRSTTTTIAPDKVDAVGLPIESTTVTGDRTVVNRYTWSHLGDPWVIGLLTKTVATETEGGTSQTRTSTATFNARGALETTTREPDAAAFKQQVTRVYTAAGNLSKTTTTGTGGAIRWSNMYWDADHVFPTRLENALGHMTGVVWNARFGVPEQVHGENGISVRIAYDDFARPRWSRERKAGLAIGPGTLIDYAAPAQDAHPKARLEVRRLVEGQGTTTSRYDAFGRLLSQTAPGLGGKESVVAHAYHGQGLSHRASLPAFVGEQPAGSLVTTFDQRGKKTRETHADGSARVFEHGSYAAPLTSWWRDEELRWHRRVVDVHGEVVRTLDGYLSNANEGPTGDDAELCLVRGIGGLLRSTVACNALDNPGWTGPGAKEIEYDLLGRVTVQRDPQLGISRTTYNGFDEVATVTSAGHTVTNQYDLIGRQRVRQVRQCAANSTESCATTGTLTGTATWDFDTKVVGALAKITGETGNTQEPFYDPATGRVARMAYGIQGETFEYVFSYDALGRPATMRYPVAAGQSPVVIENAYDAFGVLTKVFPAGDAGNELWRLNEVDAAGRIRDEVLGDALWNRYTYHPLRGYLTDLQAVDPGEEYAAFHFEHDASGNVKTREDVVFGQTETFLYDEKSRLYNVHTESQGEVVDATTKFDAWGNIASRAGADFAYDAKWQLASGAGVAYTYDDFGRARTRDLGKGPTGFGYTWFGKPQQIESASDTLRFDYDADLDRVAKESTVTGMRTVYAGGLYERQSDPNTTPVHTFSVTAGGKTVAQIRREGAGGMTTDQVRYLTTDHLGSTSLVTKKVAGVLEVVERPSFDAWGQRRDHIWKNGATQAAADAVTVGFTGHQTELESGLVNMRGRFYDPQVGRFTTADPFVQQPADMRSQNRFSYVFNNALNATDPTGFFGEGDGVPPPLPPIDPPQTDPGGNIDPTGCPNPTYCGQDQSQQAMDPGSQGSTTPAPKAPRHSGIKRERDPNSITVTVGPPVAERMAAVLATDWDAVRWNTNQLQLQDGNAQLVESFFGTQLAQGRARIEREAAARDYLIGMGESCSRAFGICGVATMIAFGAPALAVMGTPAVSGAIASGKAFMALPPGAKVMKVVLGVSGSYSAMKGFNDGNKVARSGLRGTDVVMDAGVSAIGTFFPAYALSGGWKILPSSPMADIKAALGGGFKGVAYYLVPYAIAYALAVYDGPPAEEKKKCEGPAGQ